MELPIFNDNLKSSGSWTAALAQAQSAWAGPSEQLRAAQLAQLLQRAGIPNDEAARARWREAAELVSSWAGEPQGQLTVERLLNLHRTLIGATNDDAVLRRTEPLPLNALHDPTPALLLPRMLDNAFDWFASAGFDEMHAVEKAAVVFLRLLDLHPFTQFSEATALLAASFYTERAGLPPLFVFTDEETLQRYAVVTEAAFRMLTQPLVEFFAEMLTRALRLDAGDAGE